MEPEINLQSSAQTLPNVPRPLEIKRISDPRGQNEDPKKYLLKSYYLGKDETTRRIQHKVGGSMNGRELRNLLYSGSYSKNSAIHSHFVASDPKGLGKSSNASHRIDENDEIKSKRRIRTENLPEYEDKFKYSLEKNLQSQRGGEDTIDGWGLDASRDKFEFLQNSMSEII